jgi:hypothetical protein
MLMAGPMAGGALDWRSEIDREANGYMGESETNLTGRGESDFGNLDLEWSGVPCRDAPEFLLACLHSLGYID